MTRRLCVMVTSPMTATTFLNGYLDFLKRDGWDVTLVCSNGPGVAELARRSGIAFEPLAMEREPAPLKDIRALVGAIGILRKVRPDVLVYATPKASLLGSIAGTLAGVPRRVYELWGLRLETASGLARRVFWMLEALTMRLSNIVIANSRSMAARAGELRLNGRKSVQVLGAGSSHGVDTSRFDRVASIASIDSGSSATLTDPDAPVVGFVGRVHPDKGIDTLVQALHLCADRGLNAQLLVVGGGEGAWVGPEIRGEGSVIRIHSTGFTDDVRPMLNVMDVLVLPSRREGFPNVVLEAAAMEIPAIVSNATGCVDSVSDGETGIVVPVDDASALATAIQDLLLDSPRRRQMGRAARRRVLDDFQPEEIWKLHSREWAGVGNEHDR